MKYTIHRYESVTSTNDLAVRMAEEGAPEGTVVVAREQTAGRGRRGRRWSSPPGSGLYLSFILRPACPMEYLWQVGFVASLAAADAIAQVSGLPARIKWPNDILLGGRKVCGILVEARKQSAVCGLQSAVCSLLPAVIVGVGINVNTPTFPSEITEKATSIAIELGYQIAVGEVEEALLTALNKWYSTYLEHGFAPIIRAWKKLDCTAGRDVVVDTMEGLVEGRAVEVNSAGDLIVEGKDGAKVQITAGDVILCPET